MTTAMKSSSEVKVSGGEDSFLVTYVPPVDIYENGETFILKANMPGVDEKDVKVELDDRAVVIQGEKKEEHEEKGRHWHSVEQSCGSFHRVVPLPAAVDGTRAKAKFKKGMLTVTLPKREEEKEKRKTVAVESD